MPLTNPPVPYDPTRGWWRGETGFFVGMLLALLIAGRAKMFADPGALWHPVVGERILQVGPFQGDPYSFMPWGEWFTKDWLAEAIFAACWRAAGPDGVQWFCATLLAAFYTWMYRRFRTLGCHPMMAILATLLAVAGTSFHFFARPLVFSIVCFGVVFAALADLEAGRASRWRLAWLPPVFAFWANCHPAVFGGVATVWLFVAVWGVRRLLGWDSPLRDARTAVAIGSAAVLSSAATLVNPFGWKLLAMATELMGSPLLPQMIDEHRRLFANANMLDAYLLLLLGLYAWFAVRHGLRAAGGAAWATAAWALLTMSRVRNGEFLATAFAMYASAQWMRHPLAAVLAKRDDWFRPEDDHYAMPRLTWRMFVAPVALVAVAGGLKAGGTRLPVLGAGWADLASPVAPVEALPVLREYAAGARPGQPIFNDMNFGGFVIRFLPTLKVYADDRCELLRDAGLREYAGLLREPQRLEALADRHALEIALVATDSAERPSPFDRHFAASPRWMRVHADEVATVYRRTDAPIGPAISAVPFR